MVYICVWVCGVCCVNVIVCCGFVFGVRVCMVYVFVGVLCVCWGLCVCVRIVCTWCVW